MLYLAIRSSNIKSYYFLSNPKINLEVCTKKGFIRHNMIIIHEITTCRLRAYGIAAVYCCDSLLSRRQCTNWFATYTKQCVSIHTLHGQTLKNGEETMEMFDVIEVLQVGLVIPLLRFYT